jgi:ParB family transcriptional regulator, chromosome partitioning protein
MRGGSAVIVKPIKLNCIKEELEYRHDLPDDKLSADILAHGLRAPLIVEEASRNREYYLIDGYRRLHSLKALGMKTAECKIEPITDEIQRGIKRLRMQVRTKKVTGFEMERLILYLTGRGMSPDNIADELGVSTYTIGRYLKSKNVPANLKIEAEKRGVGQGNIAKIFKIDTIPLNLRDRLLYDCLNKVIRQSEVDAISKTTKVPMFSLLPQNLMECAINECKKSAKFQKEDAERVVYLEACKDKNLVVLPRIHGFGSVYLISELQRLVSLCNPSLSQQFTSTDRRAFNNLLSKFHAAVNTVYWQGFPGPGESSSTKAKKDESRTKNNK